jgi:hypothetical protein
MNVQEKKNYIKEWITVHKIFPYRDNVEILKYLYINPIYRLRINRYYPEFLLTYYNAFHGDFLRYIDASGYFDNIIDEKIKDYKFIINVINNIHNDYKINYIYNYVIRLEELEYLYANKNTKSARLLAHGRRTRKRTQTKKHRMSKK